eukprot:9459443-Pyramimonas_sp.AAC.1
MGHGATKAPVPAQQIIRIKLADHIEQRQLQLSPAPPAAAAPQAETPSARTFAPCRPTVTTTMFLLHLFSGRRRVEDFQHHFEMNTRECNLIVLSIDVQIDPDKGDLTKPD